MDSEELNRNLMAILQRWPDASDFNFTVGKSVQIEMHGDLMEVPFGLADDDLTPEHTRDIAAVLMADQPALAKSLEAQGSADCAYSLDNGTRLRVNIFRTKGHHAIVLRVLASEPPALADLKLPSMIQEIPPLKNGLVLVTGATGSGKSTTLAAVIDQINADRDVHVVTLEDPIEFVHAHKKSTINQRELGSDFFDFSDGLRAALRQAPKVILVGEMRDRETLEIGLKAAETGHLVLSTLHTVDAGQTINRITGMFGIEERLLIQSRLAQVLRFVVSQRLLPKAGGGRVAALEIMGSSLRVREMIQNGEEEGKTFYQVIADAKPHGWQTFDQHIIELFEQELITDEVAKSYCTDRSAVIMEVDRIKGARGESTSDLGELEMAFSKRIRR